MSPAPRRDLGPDAHSRANRLLNERIAALLASRTQDPEAWSAVDVALARHGMRILRKWAAEGTLPLRVHRASGRRIRLAQDQLCDTAGREALLGETLTAAVQAFRRRALAGTGWSPQRGSSARTYFIGQCLLLLPDVYQRRSRQAHQPCPLVGENGREPRE